LAISLMVSGLPMLASSRLHPRPLSVPSSAVKVSIAGTGPDPPPAISDAGRSFTFGLLPKRLFPSMRERLFALAAATCHSGSAPQGAKASC